MTLILNGLDFSAYAQTDFRYSNNIKEIQFKNCKNLQNFPIEYFKNNLKKVKMVNCILGSLVPSNNLGIDNTYSYNIKSKSINSE